MKLWIYSLWLSIVAWLLLAAVYFLLPYYSIFKYNKLKVDAGILFPVLLLSWTAALFGFALNNIFIDNSVADKNIKMPDILKCLPSLMGLPALISFIWFIIRWYKGNPHA